MRRRLRKSGLIALGCLALLWGVTGHAALVNFTMTGTVEGSDGPDVYGLNVGDTITATGTFDDGALSIAPFNVYFDAANVGNAITITAGTLILTQANDGATGSPYLDFNASGDLVDFGFYGTAGLATFDSGAFAFWLNDEDFNFVSGTWDPTSFAMTPVPVPAAVWLLSSGLLGLAGLARRSRRGA